MTQEEIIDKIRKERTKQEQKWGQQNHSTAEWCMILGEEVGEVNKAALEAHFKMDNPEQKLKEYKEELIQVAALAINMIESLHRNELQNKAD